MLISIFYRIRDYGIITNSRNKGYRWIYQKYFQRSGSSRRWHFHAKIKTDKQNIVYLNVKLAGDTKIRRHTKVLAEANPYDPSYCENF